MTSWPVMVVLVCIFIMFYMTYELMIKIARKLGVYNPNEWSLKGIINKFQENRQKAFYRKLLRNEMKRTRF